MKNLPELDYVDLAYNSLNLFDFDYFDQVGTLSSFQVNVSHNKINDLLDNSTGFNFARDYGPQYHSNIKILDMSNNNISQIQYGYFKPAEISLIHLLLSKNLISNTSKNVFGNLQHLQWLDLSHNVISEIDFDSFKNTRNLQVLDFSHNSISEVPAELFKYIKRLRIVNFSYNNLRALPENLFFDDGLERLDLSNNQLIKIPVTSLTNIACLTLCEMNLSHNHIGAIHSMDLSNKFRSLSHLNLSNNRLVRLEDAIFATLPRLTTLDLSSNAELEINGKAFIGLENSLIDLRLDNVSITTFPDLPLPFLRKLTISNNELPSVPPELASNMSSLRFLDLSENDLTTVPLITHSLPLLRSISLAGNPITTLTNTSLIGAAETLEHLNIAHFHLNLFDTGVLNKMSSLRSLVISTYPNIQTFNIPKILENVENLRYLEIQAPKLRHSFGDINNPTNSILNTDLRREMDGFLPPKLRRIVFSGKGFNKFADTILNGIQSPFISVEFQDTLIENLPTNIFKNLGNIRNISLDFSGNNLQLSQILNPNTALFLHLPDKVFLTDFKIGKNSLTCDCNIGWIEFWQRKKRQFGCTSQTWPDFVFGTQFHIISDTEGQKYKCGENENELREVFCTNKQNEKLMEILKSDLECGWGSSASRTSTQITAVISILSIIFAIWF